MYEPSDFTTISSNPSPRELKQLCNKPPEAFKTDKTSSSVTPNDGCSVVPLWKGELDQVPGEELVVASIHRDGPVELIIFGGSIRKRTWRPLARYWHFGWPEIQPKARVRRFDVDGEKCLVFPLKANAVAKGNRGHLSDEYLHAALLVLNVRDLLSRGGSPGESDPAFWSMNDWMNSQSTHKPVAYGYVTQGKMQVSDDRYLLDELMVDGDSPDPFFRLILQNSVHIRMTAKLSVRNSQSDVSITQDLLGSWPAPDKTWKRLWPVEDSE